MTIILDYGVGLKTARGAVFGAKKTLRAAGLLAVAGVGSVVTARCGDAPTSPSRVAGPRQKSLAAAPLAVFKPTPRFLILDWGKREGVWDRGPRLAGAPASGGGRAAAGRRTDTAALRDGGVVKIEDRGWRIDDGTTPNRSSALRPNCIARLIYAWSSRIFGTDWHSWAEVGKGCTAFVPLVPHPGEFFLFFRTGWGWRCCVFWRAGGREFFAFLCLFTPFYASWGIFFIFWGASATSGGHEWTHINTDEHGKTHSSVCRELRRRLGGGLRAGGAWNESGEGDALGYSVPSPDASLGDGDGAARRPYQQNVKRWPRHRSADFFLAKSGGGCFYLA